MRMGACEGGSWPGRTWLPGQRRASFAPAGSADPPATRGATGGRTGADRAPGKRESSRPLSPWPVPWGLRDLGPSIGHCASHPRTHEMNVSWHSTSPSDLSTGWGVGARKRLTWKRPFGDGESSLAYRMSHSTSRIVSNRLKRSCTRPGDPGREIAWGRGVRPGVHLHAGAPRPVASGAGTSRSAGSAPQGGDVDERLGGPAQSPFQSDAGRIFQPVSRPREVVKRSTRSGQRRTSFRGPSRLSIVIRWTSRV